MLSIDITIYIIHTGSEKAGKNSFGSFHLSVNLSKLLHLNCLMQVIFWHGFLPWPGVDWERSSSQGRKTKVNAKNMENVFELLYLVKG